MIDLDPETEIEALIETYAGGFDDQDVEALTACFAYPAVIWQGGTGHVFADAAEMAENAGALLKVHEEAGIVLSSFEVGELILAVDGASAMAVVEWEHEDEEGVVLMDYSCHYHFIRDRDRWKIALVVNVEDDGEEVDDEED